MYIDTVLKGIQYPPASIMEYQDPLAESLSTNQYKGMSQGLNTAHLV